ncbi:MAG: response regulator [Desulfosarcina sp.]|nr:response regulator [Desulfosarcina sp.]
MKNRIEHLNLVLRAIRRVNELITREKDPDRLLQGVCDNLIENRGYHNAWIALLDPSGKFLKAVHAGLGVDFLALVDQLKRGELTHCAHFALERPDVVVTEDPLCDCPDCPLARKYTGRGAILDAEEQALFSEVADDIGFALHGIELEEARNEAVTALQESEEKFRKISSSAQDAIIMMDSGGNISFWNQAAEKVLGYTQGEVLGRELHSWLAPERFKERYQKGFKAFKTTGEGAVVGQTLELSALRKNGEEFPIELSVSAVKLKGRWNAIGILRDISERKRVEQKLIEAKEAAEAAARAKSEFLANMSHEIRTPMNGVIAAADLALSEELSPKLEHYLKIISASAYSLLGIINDILDFSKIEAGKLDLESRPFNLDDVLDRVTDMFSQKAGEKGIELLVDMDPETPKALVGDPLRLQQILKNLVDNAVKFTQSGGIILVGTQSPQISPDRITLTFFVKDTGVGIAPVYLPMLFEPFSQADASIARKYEGTGLGLCICKQLVDILGGTIGVESQPGKGSTFTFSLPFERQPAYREPRRIPPADIQGLTVLVVDDCEASRTIMQKILNSYGFKVETVSSGPASLTLLAENRTRKNPFELVILDWLMPELDGIETARRIRTDLKLALPIILMTAFGKESERQDAQKAGITAFLTKPIYPSTLFNAIMDAFGKEAFREERAQAAITTMASIYKTRLKGCRVLVVEDNPTNQQVALAVLEGAGIIAEIARNGKEAVAAVRRGRYDAVLMDIQMPEMDGYEATRRIRRDPRFTVLPIIAMTAHAMKGDDEKCLAAGMDDYIAKPIYQDRLFHILWKAVKHRAGQRAFEPQGAETPESESTPAPGGPTGALPTVLPGINIREALTTLAIDPDTFRRILLGFVKDNTDTLPQLKAAVEREDWEAIQQLAHRLNGSAANIGAAGLKAAAQALETQCREKTPTASVIHQLEIALNQVLQSLQVLADPTKTAPTEGPEHPIDLQLLQPLLAQLTTALELADPEAIETHLQAVRQHLDTTRFQNLANQIGAYDYDEALKILKGISGNIWDPPNGEGRDGKR